MIRGDSVHSSIGINEFNREEDKHNVFLRHSIFETVVHKLTSWFMFLCPLLFLSIIFAISISAIALASTIDATLLEKASISFSNTANKDENCQETYQKLVKTTNFVLYNFTSFKVISSINLLLSIVGLVLSIGYIFFYYRLKIQKRYVFASPTIPPFLIILNGFVVFFCILQSTLYWINEENIDQDVLGSQVNSSCYDGGTKETVSTINSYLETETDGLEGLVVFLFIWSVLFLFCWMVCYLITRFKLKENIFKRPI